MYIYVPKNNNIQSGNENVQEKGQGKLNLANNLSQYCG